MRSGAAGLTGEIDGDARLSSVSLQKSVVFCFSSSSVGVNMMSTSSLGGLGSLDRD